MKTDELEALAAAMNTQDILFRPEDVILSLQNRGFLKHIFPIPNCAKCVKKCCRPGIGLSLFDIARFMDEGFSRERFYV